MAVVRGEQARQLYTRTQVARAVGRRRLAESSHTAKLSVRSSGNTTTDDSSQRDMCDLPVVVEIGAQTQPGQRA